MILRWQRNSHPPRRLDRPKVAGLRSTLSHRRARRCRLYDVSASDWIDRHRCAEDRVNRVENIREFRLLSQSLGTSGMPKEEHISAIRAAGFEVVINLALPSSDGAIAHEGSLVTREGMSYFQIPVQFQAPTSADFDLFCALMRACEGRRVFVHCAANKRVSAFIYLYRVLHQRADEQRAREDLHAIWQPDEVWSRFIREQIERPEIRSSI